MGTGGPQMTHKGEEAIYAAVARLLNSGLKRPAIAADLGLTRPELTAHVQQARKRGLLTKFEAKPRHIVEGALKKRGVRVGRMSEMLKSLSPEVARWLGPQVSDGVTLAELIAAIVTDAYLDEAENTVQKMKQQSPK